MSNSWQIDLLIQKIGQVTLLEAYNVSITKKDLNVPEKPKLKCLGFTYNGAKLFNMLPCRMRETKNPDIFKTLSKEWIWENIPSY